ncbi:MAG: methyltransferase domain-containing protein [Thermoleophilia bacterium]|nr:methyltransferase domain-containing protein [Thermoleophilia bacterium]
MRGWSELYRVSVGLGLRHLRRHGYAREAVVRVVVPLDPSRYLELPWALDRLAAAPGEAVLDLASPKLFAVALTRRGARVTSVDQLETEIATWRTLTEAEERLELVVADGRGLPFPDASFDHGSSISVLEHVVGAGADAAALAELARCVRPGGRIVVTLPHALEPRIEYRASATYVDEGEHDAEGRAFFQRWYDDAAVDSLLEAVGSVVLRERSVASLSPNLGAMYTRTFPLLVPLGPFFGLLARERHGPDGDVVRLLLERR